MILLLTIVLFFSGLILIVKGGDIFVDAASWIGEKTGIPKLIVGATIVSLATTLPEMIVSFFAAAEGKIDMAVGNAIGSVTANIGLIMAIALICIPMAIRRRDYLLKSALMLGAAGIITVSALGGAVGLKANIILLLIFITALTDNILTARAEMKDAANNSAFRYDDDMNTIQAAEAFRGSRETVINMVKFIVGAAAIVMGADLLVDNGSRLAVMMGVPERIISVTIIAIGTSLPELVTTVTAIMKKQGALSVGNIIGANIIDLSLILPVSSLIAGEALPISSQMAHLDIPACLLISFAALVPSLITRRFHRVQGVIMLAAYITYLLLTVGII